VTKKSFNPWPYGLAGALIAFCVIQFSLVAIATTSFEGLVDVEYYRHGVEYGKEIDRQEKQRSLEWTVAHNLQQATKPTEKFPLRIALLDSDKKPIMHAKLRVTVGRSATNRDDQSYDLKEVGPGVYAADVRLALGNWRMNLEAEKGDNIVKADFRHRVGRGFAPSGVAERPNTNSDEGSGSTEPVQGALLTP
jgi:nitrogen fixation protein FixH